MIESGGLSGDSIQVGYIDPLKAKTGINVVRESPSSLGKLRALVESGQGGTTLFELGSGIVLQAKKLGLIEKLDWAAINPAPMFPEAKNEYGFGYQYFSTIMAWRKGAKEPQNFTEFFDTKAFPGKRTLPDYPALLPAVRAAGGGRADRQAVPARCRPRLQEAERDQEGRRGVVEGGRPAAAAHEGQRGAVRDLLVGPRRRRSGVRAELRTAARPTCPTSPSSRVPSPRTRRPPTSCYYEMSLAENQAKAAQVISYTGPSPDLDALLPKDKLWQYPTSKQNKAVQYFENAEWWAENGEAVNKKWEAFKLSL